VEVQPDIHGLMSTIIGSVQMLTRRWSPTVFVGVHA